MITRISDALIYIALRSFLGTYSLLMLLAGKFGHRKKVVERKRLKVLLTGQFYSSNWILAHLRPLAMSSMCEEIRVVSSYPIPRIKKVRVSHPPKWLVRLIGVTLARLVSFVVVAIKTRPDVVGGFHLLLNGLTASLVARIIGARSLYFCVGGPAEVLDGGIFSENRLFEKLNRPDLTIEQSLLKIVSTFDVAITMGSGATRFFQDRGVTADIHIIPGGVDLESFSPRSGPADSDLIFVGRLVPIKRVDLLLEAVRLVKSKYPDISARVVGDGALFQQLTEMSRCFGLEANIQFVGHQSDTASWFKRAKIFVLTSVSEGLSLAMMEAMACGLPAIVPDTGDLGDLVKDHVNGYLVRDLSAESCAGRIVDLMGDSDRLSRFSHSARVSAERYSTGHASERWTSILGTILKSG
jgi:L-malate glycosyltransferase